MAILTPKFFVTSVLAITADGLRDNDYEALLLDADNTILPRDVDIVPQPVVDWAEGLVAQGFELMICSNNWHERVHATAAAVGLPLVDKALKPLPFGFSRARKLLRAPKERTLMVGDQLFTDVLGAKLYGYDVCKVVPQAEHDLPHTVFLRRFERPLMGDLRPTDGLVPCGR